MRVLIVVFEKNGLFQKKEQVTAYISLDTAKGEVVIQTSDPKLREKIVSLIDFSKDDIKTQGISEETTILEKIKGRLMNQKFNGTTVKKTSYHEL